MKKLMQWKKLTACLLIMFMIVQIISPIGDVFAAVNYAESGTISLSSESTGQWSQTNIIFFETTDKSIASGSEMQLVEGSGSLTMKKVSEESERDLYALGSRFYSLGNGKYQLYLLDSNAAEAGDTVTLKGKFTADSSAGVNYQKITFEYVFPTGAEKGYWEVVEQIDYAESGTISLSSESTGQWSQTNIIFFETTDKSIASGPEMQLVEGSGSLTMKKVSEENERNLYASGSRFYSLGNGKYQLYLLDANAAEVGDTVTLEGKFATADGSAGVNYQKITFEYVFPTGAEKGYWSEVGKKVSVDSGEISLHENSTAANDLNGHSQVWLVTEETKKPTSWVELTAVSNEGSVTINEQEASVTLYGGGTEPAYLLILNGATLNAGDVITIKGKFATADDSFEMKFAETSFEYKGLHAVTGKGYWGSVTQPINYVNSGALSLHMNSTSGADSNGHTQIWFEIAENTKPSTWTELMAVEGEGSVKLNGQKISAILRGGGDEPAWLLTLYDVDLKAKDVITIEGKFAMADQSYGLNVAETSFEYKGLHIVSNKGYWGNVTEPITYANSGALSLHMNSTGGADPNGNKQIWFEIAENTKPSTWTELTPVAGEGSVKLNGQDISVILRGGGNEPAWLLELHNVTLKMDDVITIEGKFVTADNSYGLNIAKTSFVYMGLHSTRGNGYWQKETKITYTEMEINKFYGDVSEYKDNGEGWHFYLGFKNANSKIKHDSPLTGFKYKINDGEEKYLTSFYASFEKGSLFFYIPELEKKLTKNTTLTISGKAKGKTEAGGEEGIQLKSSVTLYGNQYGWSLTGFPKAPTYTSFEAKSVNKATSYNSTYNMWHVYLDPSAKLPGAKDSAFQGLEIEIDGKTYPVTVFHASHEDTLFFAIEGDKLPKDCKNGTKVVLKAGKAHQNGTNLALDLKKDVVLYKFFEGLTLKKPSENIKYTDISITKMSRATKFNMSSKSWYLVLRTNDEIPGEDGLTFYDLKVTLNGKQETVKVVNQGGTLYLRFGEDILPSTVKTGTLTIKSGAKAIGGDGQVGIKFVNDFEVYLFNGVWSEEEFTEVNEVERSCIKFYYGAHTKGSTLWGFYFRLNGEFPGISWYNKFDKYEVELNGRKIAVELNKADYNNSMYFPLDETIVGTFKKGDILKINKGSVAEDGGYKLTITNDFTLIYTGQKWMEYRDTDVQAPDAQNLWDVARYDSKYIPLSEDGTVLTSDQDKYCAITSSEKMMDYTVSFSGKKIYNDIGTPSFYLILRGNPMSENDPISRELCYGYVVTFAGYEITEKNMPNNPELWGTRSGYIYVWKNGENQILQDQYLMGMEHNMNNDPFFKVDETYNYEVSIYNITETSVCIEFKVNGEVVYKCYDDASSDPMDPAVNAGTFGLYPMASSYIGGEVVELGNVIAEAEECLVGERIRVSATYPSILEGVVFTVDKEGATIEDGIFSATVPGTYTISATYNGKELTPLTIKVNDYADEDVDGETGGMNFWVIGITIVTVVLAGGLTTFVLLKKKRKQKGNLEA